MNSMANELSMWDKTRNYIGTGMIFILVLLSGCSGTATGEETRADITTAKIEGRSAAREILTKSWHDTTELTVRIREIRSRRARYDSIGKHKAAETFDSTFVSTIRHINPIVGKLVEKI